MNFFESQDAAKRNTTKLIVLFALAVISLIVITNLLVMVIFGFAASGSAVALEGLAFDWYRFLLVGAGVTAIILIGSLYKIGTLSGGGARVAEMMNGRLLVQGSNDLHQQRVLNVVEEMAIASGTPVPPVYLMEEAGINAFAAGYSPSDAVIGVTRGAIETLSRDQLQGVIAHEFSHILHGDMRINIRLIGVLHGILILGIIGYHLLRGSSRSRRSKDSGGIVFLGLGLMVVGYVGTFFGNLIKAAVSRQREFLADASAVQFTRNPDGIAGALMQIDQHSQRSYLQNPNSAEISHALFEEASAGWLHRLYATHPPLPERISAILPRWDGSYDLIQAPAEAPRQAADDAAAGELSRARQEKMAAVLTGAAGVLVADSMIDQVGNPESRHLQYADELLRNIPAVLLDAAHEPSAARAVVYYLVMDKDAADRQQQLALLENSADEGVFAELQSLLRAKVELAAEQRMPLLEIAISSLRQLSLNQYQLFRQNFSELIKVDKKISLLEWALQKILFQHLDAVFEKGKSHKLGKKDIAKCQHSCAVLLSILAHSNRQEQISAEQAFLAGSEKLDAELEMLAIADIDFAVLNRALDELRQLRPLQKPALLKACAACITADREVRAIEAELMRAIAATIECPMPPLLV